MNTSQDWIKSAQLRLEAARLLFEGSMYTDALTRTYFAVFQAAKAVLESKDLRPSTHKGVRGMIGERESIRTTLDTGLVASLNGERDRCDYELIQYPRSHVEKRLSEAEAFIEDARKLL